MIARAQSGDATPVSESFFDSFNKAGRSRFTQVDPGWTLVDRA